MTRINSPCCPLTSTRVPHAAHTCMCRNTPTYTLNKCKWMILTVPFFRVRSLVTDLWLPLPQLSRHPSWFVLCQYAEERGYSDAWHNPLCSATEINEAIYYLWAGLLHPKLVGQSECCLTFQTFLSASGSPLLVRGG